MVDHLDELVERGLRIPFADRVVVERNALLNLLDQIRLAIPEEIQRAAELEQERDYLLREADDQAAQIVADAQARAEQLLQEHLIRQAAEDHAAAIIAQAEVEAAQICDQAEAYAASELRSLERHLTRLQRVVNNGVQHLEQRHQERLQATQPQPQPVPSNGSGQPHPPS